MMTCIILAAGYATRLYPLTENFPKPLLDVGGRTIIDRLIDDLEVTTDIDTYVIVTNDKFAHHFEAWASERRTQPTDSSYIILNDGTCTNETRLGAVRDIELAITSLGIDGDLLIMAGDNVLDFSLSGFLAYAKEKQTSCVMCHEEKELKKQQKTAIITVDESGLITSYEEKPREPKGHLAVPPFYICRAEDARRIPEALRDGCGADAPGSFAAWLSQRVPVHAWPMPGQRYDIGDLGSYHAAQALFAASGR